MADVLFIAGTSFCGSTLASMILSAHPEMASVGELTGPSHTRHTPAEYPCSCGATLASCPFWQEVGKRAADRDVDFGPQRWDLAFLLGRGPLLRLALSRSLRSNRLDDLRDAAVAHLPRLRARVDELGQRNRVVIESVLESVGARVFVDASKDPVRVRFLRRVPGLDVWLLHLVRDSRGFVSSDQRRSGRSLAASARIWARRAEQVERLRRVLPADRFLRLRYEDLCSDVEGQLRRITDFVGVEPFTLPVRFRDHDHHVMGNAMRRGGTNDIRLDERWRESLTPQQIAEIDRRTRRGRMRYGYT
jgi:hypothetical protein